MTKILILVEGQTEEAFIKTVLAEHLRSREIHILPIIVTTKRLKSGPKFKGGVVSYRHVRDDLLRILKDSSATIVTTMIDYYGLPDDFPGKAEAKGNSFDKVKFVEERFAKDINHLRFRGYLNLHEFEGLLFSNPSEITKTLNENEKLRELHQIRAAFKTPEEINDSPKTAPSKRLYAIFPTYSKPLHGSLISKRIGLETIRSQCPHFDEWVIYLENIR